MKPLFRIGLCLMLAASITACDKNDEPTTTGHLTIKTYSYDPTNPIRTEIYTELGNSIYAKSDAASTTEIDLNAGNYSIGVSRSTSGGIIKTNFQIRAGRTTLLSCGGDLQTDVTYK